MTISPTANQLIDFLNELIAIDPDAVNALINARVPCNETMAHHPTVQVGLGENFDSPHKYLVGFLGVLNGFAGAYDDGPRAGCGFIAAIYSEDDKLIGFKRLEDD
jgi:hypothetical protein